MYVIIDFMDVQSVQFIPTLLRAKNHIKKNTDDWIWEPVDGGLLQKLNLHPASPLTHIIEAGSGFLAGGCFKDLLLGRVPKDLDLFFITDETFAEGLTIFEASNQWLKIYTTPHCTAFASEGTIVELISERFGFPETVVGNFDFTLTQCGLVFRGGQYQLFMCSSWRDDLQKKRLRYGNVGVNSSQPLERLFRYNTYNFTPSDATLQKALAFTCDAYACETPTSVSSFEALNYEVGRFTTLWHIPRERSRSFDSSHLIMHDAVHEISHLMENVPSRSEPEPDVLEAFKAFYPGYIDSFMGDRPLRGLRGLAETLPMLSDMSPQGREDLLVLVNSASITREASWWASGQIIEAWVRASEGWPMKAREQHLRNILSSPELLMNYSEWKNYISSDSFNPRILPVFASIFFAEAVFNRGVTARSNVSGLRNEVRSQLQGLDPPAMPF